MDCAPRRTLGKRNHIAELYGEWRDSLFLHASIFLYPFKCTFMSGGRCIEFSPHSRPYFVLSKRASQSLCYSHMRVLGIIALS